MAVSWQYRASIYCNVPSIVVVVSEVVVVVVVVAVVVIVIVAAAAAATVQSSKSQWLWKLSGHERHTNDTRSVT